MRAVATGAIGLSAGALPGRAAIDAERAARLAADAGCAEVQGVGAYWVAQGPASDRVLVLDRYGDQMIELAGALDRTGDAATIQTEIDRLTRHRGPVTLVPTVWVVQSSRFTELSSGDRAASAAALVGDADEPFAIVIGQA